jgi:hypothetical protein
VEPIRSHGRPRDRKALHEGASDRCRLGDQQTIEVKSGLYSEAFRTAGILYRTRTPLMVWFRAAYLLTIDKRGFWLFGPRPPAPARDRPLRDGEDDPPQAAAYDRYCQPNEAARHGRNG